MRSPTPTLTSDERRDAAAAFRRHGITSSAVAVVDGQGRDEAVFVVDPAATGPVPEAALTAELSALLGRKVWISTERTAFTATVTELDLSA